MAESVHELFALHMFRAAPAIGERLPGLPTWLAGLVTIMLAKKRDERPTSMHGIARALGEGMKAARVAGRSGTSRGGGAAALVAAVVAFIGVSALVVAVWSASRSSGLPTRARPLEAAASGGSPDIAPETAFAPPRAIVVPTPPAAPIPPAGAEPAPRQPARAGERPPPARSARPSATKPKHVGNTDGIVESLRPRDGGPPSRWRCWRRSRSRSARCPRRGRSPPSWRSLQSRRRRTARRRARSWSRASRR